MKYANATPERFYEVRHFCNTFRHLYSNFAVVESERRSERQNGRGAGQIYRRFAQEEVDRRFLNTFRNLLVLQLLFQGKTELIFIKLFPEVLRR